MPNQRSKDKIYLGGFVHKELHARFMRQAKQAGMENNKFGFAAILIDEALRCRRTRRKSPSKPPKAARPKG